MYDVFSEPWILAWADELRASEKYQRAAATWEGSVALEITDPPMQTAGSLPRPLARRLPRRQDRRWSAP